MRWELLGNRRNVGIVEKDKYQRGECGLATKKIKQDFFCTERE